MCLPLTGRRRRPAQVHFTLGELGLNGPAYVYDYFSGVGERLDAGDKFLRAAGPGTHPRFYVGGARGQKRHCFFGRQGKFVGTGKQRIESLRDEAGRLTVGVVLAANEKSVVLHGYAVSAPKVTVRAGEDDEVQYDPATQHFTVIVKADANRAG